MSFSPDGSRALTGSNDGTAKLWDANTGAEIRTFSAGTILLLSVAFSPDGARAVAGYFYGMVRLWDVNTGAEIRSFQGHEFGVTSVAFSPGGERLLTGGYDNTAKLWDANTGILIQTFSGHSDFVLAVAFSPDGASVLTGSFDATAKHWDANTGVEIRTFAGHTSYVNSVAFSADGARVLTGSSDYTAKLWNADTGEEIRTFLGHRHGVSSVAFSPDGARIVTGSYDNTAKVWTTSADFCFELCEGEDPADMDDDGLSDCVERCNDTDALAPDTVGDGMLDGYEVSNDLDPRQDDSGGDADGDSLTNLEEFLLGTSAREPDTDGDGMPDGYEVANGLNPLVDDCEEDLDGDGLTNCEEFAANTAPNDNADPPDTVFVSVAGHDDTGDGTEANPWRTIGFAMTDVSRYSELHPVTIHTGPGYYEEFVRFVPNVTLQGAGPESTAISVFDPINPDFNLVEASDNTVIRDLTIILPFGSFSIPVLVRIDNVDATLDNVVLDGSISIANPTGVYITGGSSSGSVIRNSTLINLDRGIHSVNSAVTVTRNLFDNIERDAVFIGFSSGPALTPVLGAEGDVVNTGFNRFREIGGDFIEYDNADPAHTFAQFNDFGVYTAEEIASQFTVPSKAGSDQIEFDRFIGNKLTLPSVIAIDLLDDSTDNLLPDCAEPVVELDGDVQNRDVPSGLWIFQVSSPRAYNVAADADGYAPGSINADAPAGQVTAYPMTLATNFEANGCEGEGEGEGDGCAASPNNSRDALPYGDIVAIFATAMFLLSALRRPSHALS